MALISDTGGGDERVMADINVTPLVDVMLVLLIIFMVTAPMLHQGIEVALPKAEAENLPQRVDDPIVLTMTRNKLIYIRKRRCTRPSWSTACCRCSQSRGDQSVLLKADRDLPYGEIMDLLTLLNRGGITNVGMVTERRAPGDDVEAVDTVLEQRAHTKPWYRGGSLIGAVILHVGLAAASIIAPRLFAERPKTQEFVAVRIVSQATLGQIEVPPPPPPPAPEPPAPEPEVARRPLLRRPSPRSPSRSGAVPTDPEKDRNRPVQAAAVPPRRRRRPRRSTRLRSTPPIPTRPRRRDVSAHRRATRSRPAGPPRSPASTTPTSRTVTTPIRCWRAFAPAGCGRSSAATSRWCFTSASTPTAR